MPVKTKRSLHYDPSLAAEGYLNPGRQNGLRGFHTMAGVWTFHSDGVCTLDEDPLLETSIPGPAMGHRVLVHKASNTSMTSYEELTSKLHSHGWYPYFQNEEMRQFHQGAHCVELITLPAHFSDLRTTHMYDVVVKTRSAFEVRDVT